MTDLALAWDAGAYSADLAVDVAALDLATDDGLRSAVMVSLLTDRRVDAEELPAGETRRRGWWGDTLASGEIGSRLWLLARSKRTPAVLRRAESYAAEALEWLVEDDVVERVDVRAEDRAGRLLIHIDIRRRGSPAALDVDVG